MLKLEENMEKLISNSENETKLIGKKFAERSEERRVGKEC